MQLHRLWVRPSKKPTLPIYLLKNSKHKIDLFYFVSRDGVFRTKNDEIINVNNCMKQQYAELLIQCE